MFLWKEHNKYSFSLGSSVSYHVLSVAFVTQIKKKNKTETIKNKIVCKPKGLYHECEYEYQMEGKKNRIKIKKKLTVGIARLGVKDSPKAVLRDFPYPLTTVLRFPFPLLEREWERERVSESGWKAIRHFVFQRSARCFVVWWYRCVAHSTQPHQQANATQSTAHSDPPNTTCAVQQSDCAAE